MISQVDILETEIFENYPKVLETLLKDQTSGRNIIWATNNYERLGDGYMRKDQIEAERIIGINGNIIKPRVQKNDLQKLSRVKNMAEVFTPSWVCNAQNNLIDRAWFQRDNVFNKELPAKRSWLTNRKKIKFPKGKVWKDYINDRRLEISCGEAPYITSRYDTTSGEFIEVQDRIGLLDRKLRVLNENVEKNSDWLNYAERAYKNIYAFEWQGDSLLLARESMLFCFIENYKLKFDKEPPLTSMQRIAKIISWNVWQMDGLKGVIPLSCGKNKNKTVNLFGEEEVEIIECIGCRNDDINAHNGVYSLIMDWFEKDDKINKGEKKIRFVDLIKK